jgi:rifampin ADP-ribosylating transferase
MDYTEDDIQEALRPIDSLISKSEKAQQKLAPNTWQHAMLRDNLMALHLASALMRQEAEDTSGVTPGDLAEALRALDSMIARTEKTEATFSPGTSQHSLQRNRLKALRVARAVVRSELSEQRFYHGTKADLKPGDLITPGYSSNFGTRRQASFVYLTATLDAATWGAELAVGDGPGRIYTVEPTGPIEDDPNLTDKRFPGNPTKSYRTREPLRVTGEIADWEGHSPEALKAMRDNLERLKALGIEAIED